MTSFSTPNTATLWAACRRTMTRHTPGNLNFCEWCGRDNEWPCEPFVRALSVRGMLLDQGL